MKHRAISTVTLAILACLLASCAQSPYPVPGKQIFASVIIRSVLGEKTTVFLVDPKSPEEKFPEVPAWSGAFPEWSPDGNWIASISTKSPNELILRDAQTGSEQVSRLPKAVLDLAWAPDSKRIAFSTFGSEPGELLVYWMDIKCLQRMVNCQPQSHLLTAGHSVAWSPDGLHIAFAWNPGSESQGQGKDAIFVLSIDSLSEPRLVSGGLEDCRDPDWSPDGSLIVFSCLFDIFTVSQDGGNLTNLTAGEFPSDRSLESWWPRDFQPTWGPKGDRIFFLSERDGGSPLPDEDTLTNGLYAMDPDGTNVVALTSGDEFSIRWYTWTVAPSKSTPGK